MMDKLYCYMGKLHCEITTENLIVNEDMKNFSALLKFIGIAKKRTWRKKKRLVL